MRLNTPPPEGATPQRSSPALHRLQDDASGSCQALHRAHCGNSNRPSLMDAQKCGAAGCDRVFMEGNLTACSEGVKGSKFRRILGV